jgi:hypothetical protein
MASLVDRMIRAAKLEVALYEEVEADTTATGQAMTVVVLSSVAAGIGGWGDGGLHGVLGNLIGALGGWVIWAFLTFLIGTKLMPGPNTRSNVGELLRTTGFASAPGTLRLLGGLPGIGGLLGVIAGLWMLAAFVVAVRQALDYEETWRAVVVCVLGFAVYLGFFVVVGVVFFGAAAALFGGHA